MPDRNVQVSSTPEPVRSIVRLTDGPEAGGQVVGWPGEPPDQIVVFRATMVGGGRLVCCADDGEHPYLPGDAIYKKVSRSDLFDHPDFKGHPNVMPGCSYTYVRTPDPEVTP